MKKGFFVVGTIGTLIGGAAGVVAGLLTAKKSGKETRADLKSKAEEMKKNTQDKASDTIKNAKDKIIHHKDELKK